MKEKGCGTLADKIFQRRYDKVARDVVDEDEVSSEDMDFQIEVSKNVSSSRAKKTKQPLIQTLPMAAFLTSKTQDKHEKSRRGQQHQPSNFVHVQESNSVMSDGPSQDQVQTLAQPPEIQQKKKLACQQDKSQKQYCAPGSMLRFMNMRKLQGSRGQQSNDVNLQDIKSNSPLADEQCGPQQPTNVTDLDGIDVSEDTTHSHVQVPNSIDETIQKENSEKMHRGRAILEKIHARIMDKRVPVFFNDLNQPIGPTKEIVADFAHLLGTLVKDSAFAPLNYITWKYMPLSFKGKIWEYVQKKFILDKDTKKYVLEKVNAIWRLHKARTKEKYFNKEETMEQMLAKRPEYIPEHEFKKLIECWTSAKGEEISRRIKENRAKQSDMYTMGPKSYAVLQNEMKQNDPNNQDPSLADLYIESRQTRKL